MLEILKTFENHQLCAPYAGGMGSHYFAFQPFPLSSHHLESAPNKSAFTISARNRLPSLQHRSRPWHRHQGPPQRAGIALVGCRRLLASTIDPCVARTTRPWPRRPDAKTTTNAAKPPLRKARMVSKMVESVSGIYRKGLKRSEDGCDFSPPRLGGKALWVSLTSEHEVWFTTQPLSLCVWFQGLTLRIWHLRVWIQRTFSLVPSQLASYASSFCSTSVGPDGCREAATNTRKVHPQCKSGSNFFRKTHQINAVTRPKPEVSHPCTTGSTGSTVAPNRKKNLHLVGSRCSERTNPKGSNAAPPDLRFADLRRLVGVKRETTTRSGEGHGTWLQHARFIRCMPYTWPCP